MPDPNYILHRGVAFLLPAKCANTSLKQAILMHRGDPVDTDRPGWFVRIHNAARLPYIGRARVHEADLVVGAVRDPVERLVSCWRDKVGRVAQLEFRKPGKVTAGTPWPDFVAAVCSTPDEECDQHFRSLTADLVVNGQEPDILLNTEHLEQDWRYLEKALNWVPRFECPRLHETGDRCPRPDVTQEQRGLIRERFAEDYSRFFGLMGLEATA